MRFKKDKMGSNLDDQNLDIQAKFTPLQLQRQKFINQMKNTKSRENETISGLKDFESKLKAGEVPTWMRDQVSFHVDSEKAYNFDKTKTSMEQFRRD